ncbi:virulence RhuM family protein [Adlercreutzia equolifaciens]|uniref:virulence RhuM family protein n=1 Tax=Adlercreutzia equolifaciens TaxID=446660 RepID=UPI0026DABADB|nr:RhuM family protein [Adlercreutzia equolifaciens]
MSEAASTSNIVLFESSDGEVRLDVAVDAGKDEIWLNRSQMSLLFGRDVKTIGKHIANALKEELENSPKPTVAKFATVQKEGNREVERQVEYYNLDVIISVGYRVKSQRGVEFRRWATDVLRRYIVEGRAENEKRLIDGLSSCSCP